VSVETLQAIGVRGVAITHPPEGADSEARVEAQANACAVYIEAAVELRVHGVSGTAPESLLDRVLVTQVAGDDIAGFYRPRLPDERTDDSPHPFLEARPNAAQLEGYNWGGLTSGSPGRALWLFLLPFTLINIAPRARPLPAEDSAFLRTVTWLVSRWLALALTLLLVVTTAGIGVNLAGWQCTFSDACAGASNNPVVRGVFGQWVDGARRGGWKPEAVLLVGAVLPLLLLFALWFVSKRTIDRYESVSTKIGYEHGEANAMETTLDSPWMWRNEHPVRRLRATHMQAGVAIVIWVTSAAASSADLWTIVWPWNWGGGDGLSVAVAVVTALVMAYCFVVLAVPSFVGHDGSSLWQGISAVIWLLLLVAAVLSTAKLLLDGIADSSVAGAGGSPSALPGFEGTQWVVVMTTFGLLAALIVVVVLQAIKAPLQPASDSVQARLKPGLGGVSAAALAAAAVLLAAVFSASAFTIAAAWLNTGSLKPAPSQVSEAHAQFVVPDSFRMATFVYTLSVVFAVGAGFVALVRLAWGFGFTWRPFRMQLRLGTARVPAGAVSNDYGTAAEEDTEDEARDRRRRSIERAMYVGRILERLVVLAFVLVAASVVFTLGGAAVLFFGGPDSHVSFAKELMTQIRGDGKNWVPEAEAWGAYAAVLSLLLLVAVASLAFRVPTTRRVVGIIWDVASFWPRACHPLAAPSYAERTVPDLVTRLHWHLKDRKRPVVLAGHSQGSVLSAAAIFYLGAHEGTEECIQGISLLTFGCVLRRLYARFFPVYFGIHKLHDLQALITSSCPGLSLPRWINLWRYTDYLGGQVTTGPPQQVPPSPARQPTDGLLQVPPITGPRAFEWHSPDPPYFERRPGTTTYSAPSRHSNFWSDESGIFQLAVARLLERSCMESTQRALGDAAQGSCACGQ